MVTKLVALIFASFLIQDAVSSEQAHDDRVAVKNNLNDAADHQNSGKIWNWTFGNDSPATNEQGKLKTPTESDFPTDERAPNAKKNDFELFSNSKVALGDKNAPAAGNRESFLKKSPNTEARVDPRYAVPNRNLVKFRNQFNNNNQYNNNNNKNNNQKYESEEYDFDESDDDDSFDSQSENSQSYDDDDDDENDLSPENKYSKGYEYSPDTRMRNEQYAKPFLANRRGSKVAPPAPLPEMEQPAMQTRSLQMRTLRGNPRRFGSVSM